MIFDCHNDYMFLNMILSFFHIIKFNTYIMAIKCLVMHLCIRIQQVLHQDLSISKSSYNMSAPHCV